MRRVFPVLLMLCAAAWAQTGPTQASSVFTLPNEMVTPSWHNFAPSGCVNNYDSCADDNRFWEEWDFSTDFNSVPKSSNAPSPLDTAFDAVASQGKYQSVMLLMPLGDVTADVTANPPNYFANNIHAMYTEATNHGLTIETVLFPKWKYGAEWCYLYARNAPTKSCPTVSGTTEALAHQKLVQLMDYVQAQSGTCSVGKFNSWFAIWYGWTKSEFPYQGKKGQVLQAFWSTLPTVGAKSLCNLQASYIPWLDSGYGPSGSQYVDSPDVHSLQTYVEQQGAQLYVDTELYSQAQIQQYANTFHNQTVITGYWDAADITSWAKGMCTNWNWASKPQRLGVWTLYDRDVDPPYELYRSYINNDMAVVGSICTP